MVRHGFVLISIATCLCTHSIAQTTSPVSVGSSESRGNGVSDLTSISSGGRYVAFVSSATDLVPGDTNGFGEVFLHDTVSGSTMRVSVDSRVRELRPRLAARDRSRKWTAQSRKKAMRPAVRAQAGTKTPSPRFLDTLAAAEAATGRFQKAARTAARAKKLVSAEQSGYSLRIEARRQAYARGEAWREILQ